MDAMNIVLPIRKLNRLSEKLPYLNLSPQNHEEEISSLFPVVFDRFYNR